MKIGFIGCGNMASAMIGGILRQGIFSKDEIIVSNLTDEGRARSEKTLGVVTTLDQPCHLDRAGSDRYRN